ncbi:hypothetical protein QEN19_000102 [Hanseniaspora menglaensis]
MNNHENINNYNEMNQFADNSTNLDNDLSHLLITGLDMSKNPYNNSDSVIFSVSSNTNNCFLFEIFQLVLILKNKTKVYLIKDEATYSLAIISKECETKFSKSSHDGLSIQETVTHNNRTTSVTRYILSLNSGSLEFYDNMQLSELIDDDTEKSIFSIDLNLKKKLIWPIFTIQSLSVANIEFENPYLNNLTKVDTAISKHYSNKLENHKMKHFSNQKEVYDKLLKFFK